MERRKFLRQMGCVAGAVGLTGIDTHVDARFSSEEFWQEMEQINSRTEGIPATTVAQDESFWVHIQQSYASSPMLINLNNGGVSPQPFVVQEALERYNRLANEAPSYYMWRTIDAGREPLRKSLAKLGGCSPEEISICRNTTEALDNVIFGLNLKSGDEVVLTKKDYPNMMNAWRQREKRDGIVLKWIDLKLPCENDADFINKFQEAITPRTKVLHITHLINWVGQIQPIAKIAALAKGKGIATIADAAHSFAHFEYKIPDLGCDYFATSLHKWLSAPLGTGMLYVKKDKIKDLWPLIPNQEFASDNIRKFEALGTRSMPAEMAIHSAIDFHNGIGSARKEARLRFLKNYWAKEAIKMDGVKLSTSLKDEYSCALALVSVAGLSSLNLADGLYNEFKIHVISIDYEDISGVRITPHVYTKLSDLDYLLEGLLSASKSKDRKAEK